MSLLPIGAYDQCVRACSGTLRRVAQTGHQDEASSSDEEHRMSTVPFVKLVIPLMGG